MGVYYRLADRYCLRGWDKLPYALVDTCTGNAAFLTKQMMDTYLMCDGSWDFDSPLTPAWHAAHAQGLLAKGRVVACEEGQGVADEQRYRLYPNRYMRTVHWSITGRCNYRCRHCFMSAPEARYSELSHDSLMDVASQLAECGTSRVSLTGGEPLVRPDFLELVEELSRLGIVVAELHTNGALLTDRVLDALDDLGQRPDVILSFDGVGFHDWMRGVAGAEKATSAAIARCVNKGFVARARMCAYRDNLASLRDTANHLAGIGCASLHVGSVNAMGEWLGNADALTPTFDEYLEAALAYVPQYYEDGMPLPITLAGAFSASPEEPDRYAIAPYQPGFEDGHRLLFTCARSLLQIYPDGRPAICDVLGPDFVDMPPIASDDPDQRVTRLPEVLATGSPYLQLMDMRHEELLRRNDECRTCPYLRVCGSGCRACAYQATGSIFERDPQVCTFFRAGWACRFMDAVHAARPTAVTPLEDDPLFGVS